MNFIMVLFEQLYEQFMKFCSHTPAQWYILLLNRYPWITEIPSYGDIPSHINISRLDIIVNQSFIIRLL